MLALTFKILIAYGLGSISGSLLVGALRHVDIRLLGSGNAGGTNAFRTQGFRFALAVVAIDFGKGVIAAAAVSRLPLPGLNETISPLVQTLFCAFAAVAGHCFPVWYGFRGGKGAATAVGALAVIQPLVLAPLLGIWLLVLGLSGWVSLATMVAAVSLIPILSLMGVPTAGMVFAAVLAAFLLFTHRSNIYKLRQGTEHRFDKAMFRNWLR